MAEINRNIIHRGKGIIEYNGKQIGVADDVGFMFHKIGIVTEGESEDTCYGMINGNLTDTSLVDDFNSPHPTPSILKLTVKDKDRPAFDIVIEEVEFIENIPDSGTLHSVEFHGVAKI